MGSLDSTEIVGFTRVRAESLWVHAGSFGCVGSLCVYQVSLVSLGFVLGADRFIWIRGVHL